MNKKDKWLIYLHKNKINNKVYVGQTKCLDPNKRWRDGTHYQNTYFGRAIKKYGWNNFEHIILEDNILSSEEADKREQYWIAFYNSNNNKFGYNLTSGGKKYYTINKKLKKERSLREKEKWKNKEYRIKMSKKLKEYWDNHPEIKEQRGQKVKCVETNQIFNTYKQAGDWCGLINYKNAFLLYFKGKRYSCGKHPKTHQPLHWIKIDVYNNEIINNQNFDPKKSDKSLSSTKKVKCIETNQIFNSLVEACKWCNLKNSSSITNMIKGRKKSAGKHPDTKEPLHWEYV